MKNNINTSFGALLDSFDNSETANNSRGSMVVKVAGKTWTLEEISGMAFKNRQLLEASEFCGCYYCCKIFKADSITEWVKEKRSGGGFTALCPHCGIDSVIPQNTQALSELNTKLLKSLQQKFF